MDRRVREHEVDSSDSARSASASVGRSCADDVSERGLHGVPRAGRAVVSDRSRRAGPAKVVCGRPMRAAARAPMPADCSCATSDPYEPAAERQTEPRVRRGRALHFSSAWRRDSRREARSPCNGSAAGSANARGRDGSTLRGAERLGQLQVFHVETVGIREHDGLQDGVLCRGLPGRIRGQSPFGIGSEPLSGLRCSAAAARAK
jgi:hypothetical protein